MKNQKFISSNWLITYLLIAIFLMPFFIAIEYFYFVFPGYFMLIEIHDYIKNPMALMNLVKDLDTCIVFIGFNFWFMLSFYLPIQITQNLSGKLINKMNTIKLKCLQLMSYIFWSIVFQFCLILPVVFMAWIYEKNFPIVYFRIPIGLFILWAFYKNIYNFKKLFKKEFWNFKIIVNTCSRFLVLSILSGIVTCGGILIILKIIQWTR